MNLGTLVYPPPKDTPASEGWVAAGIRHAEPLQAFSTCRLAPFSLPTFTPSGQACTGWTQRCGFGMAERREPNPSCSPRAAMSTHRTLWPLQGPSQSSKEALSPFCITFYFLTISYLFAFICQRIFTQTVVWKICSCLKLQSRQTTGQWPFSCRSATAAVAGRAHVSSPL